MIVFATAGKSDSFKGNFPQDLPHYLNNFGLNGFEIQCGRGVNISSNTRFGLPELAKRFNIKLSIHAPYFISLSSTEEEKRIKSIGYILETARAAKQMGAERIIVHSGSCAKIKRREALALALETLKKARAEMDSAGLEKIIICPETMGKVNQLGTVEEVLELCSFDSRMIPCIDFGHIYARNHGEIDYADILDKLDKYRTFHAHFSRQEYNAGGEKKHLTFAEGSERGFGPEFEPLIDEIAARGFEPFIVCESDGTQAEDAAEMAEYYRGRVSIQND
jgi:deoxyribonuclease-4